MAQQLVFTSTPQGLEPGRSGYCTVARHKDIRHRLVRELERLSVYDFGQQTGSDLSEISIFRKMPLGSEEYYVLTKIRDAGLDYTNRTNYLAHHLVLDGFEIATCPSPAEIFLNWDGWLETWTDGPRYLGEEEAVNLSSFKSSNLIPCQSWLQMTNDPGNAASLISPDMMKPIVIEGKPGSENTLLTLFAESSALLKISLDAWDFSFTTFLQGNDDSKVFSWIGITGQPAGERLKQGVKNYLDLRNWSSSIISDTIDPSFEHLARKGPKKVSTKKKSATVTQAPFSEQELQRAKASAPAASSVAPSGSTVASQQSPNSTQNRKKRPWLLQLAVISTALCLLVSLIVGLTMNWGDWFHDEVADTPDPSTPLDSPTPVSPPEETLRTVALDSPVQLDRVEFLPIVAKHPFMRWVELDAGGGQPVRVNLSEDQQDLVGEDLQLMDSGDELQVVINRDKDENLFFESVQRAPAPEKRGVSRSIELDDKESISLSEDKETLFFKSGEKTYPLALPLLSRSERTRMLEMHELIQSGESIRFNPRVKDGRIVYFEPIILPSDLPANPDLNVPPTGKPMTLSAVRGETAFRLEEEQKRIFIRVRGTETLPYVFKETERERIMKLVKFLEAGEQEVDLDIREDGDQITSLQFELPLPRGEVAPSDNPKDLDPNSLTPEMTIVFWIPGKLINDRWTIDLKKRYVFENSTLPDFVVNALDAGIDSDGQPKAWMADFQPSLLMERGIIGGFDFDPYSYERARDRLDPLKISNFHLKQTVNGKDFFSFSFKFTKKESIQINLETPETENFIRKGKLVRFPMAGSDVGCLDMFFLSNSHSNLTEKQKLGESFISRLGSIEVAPPWLGSGKGFNFLTPKSSSESYSLALSVHSSVSSNEIRPLMDKEPENLDWKDSDGSDLPEAFLLVASETPLKGTIISDQEYAIKVQSQILLEKQEQDKAGAENLAKFGNRQAWEPVFEYMKYARGNGSVFNYQTLGEFIYISTFQNLRKILEDARYNLLLSKLPADFYQVEALSYDLKLSKVFWEEVAKAVKDQIEESIDRPRRYDDETAARDIVRLFDFLKQLVHAEMAFGFVDSEGLYEAMQGFRHRLSLSTDEKSTIRKLQSQTQKNSEMIRVLFRNRLDELQFLEKNLLRYDKLESADLKLCSSILSDRVKYGEFLPYYRTVGGGGSSIDGLLEKVNERVTGPKLEVSQRDAFINGVPWALSILKKTSSGDYVKESDFLLLAPPQIQ